MNQSVDVAEIKAEALREAADWLDSQAADFAVSKIADEGVYNATVKAVAQVLEGLAESLRQRASALIPERRKPE